MPPMRQAPSLSALDVAVALRQIAPGHGWLAALFGNRLTLPFTRFFCNRFADLLFAWNKRKGRW